MCQASLSVQSGKVCHEGVRAFCLERGLHSFQMVFLSSNYVKGHTDRNPLAHVMESHSSLAIPEMCVGFKIYDSVKKSGKVTGGELPCVAIDRDPTMSFFWICLPYLLSRTH